MRIALFAAAFPPAVGGIERFSEVLADWLAGRGHDVVVATATAAPPDFDRSRPYQVVRRPSLARMVSLARRADAVHVKSLSGRAVLASISGGRAPVVTHGHHQVVCPDQIAWSPRGACTAGPRPGPCAACGKQGARAMVHVRRQRWAALAARTNVAVSDYLSARLGLPRSTTVYNPVELRAFAPLEAGVEEDGLVAFAGRLSSPKGLDLLIRALELLPGIRVEVAGDGPARPEWERLAGERGVADRVRFLGAVPLDDVVGLYRRAAVVCVPSVWPEPFGYAAAEAMALGRAVVAAPTGALPELLADGRGYLARAPEVPALADAVRRALDDGAERAAVGSRAAAFAREQLHPDVIGGRYLSLYGA